MDHTDSGLVKCFLRSPSIPFPSNVAMQPVHHMSSEYWHAGERVVHISDNHSAACNQSWERYRERLRQILSQGRAKGRLYKSAQRLANTAG